MPAIILTDDKRRESVLYDGDSSLDQKRVNVEDNHLKEYQMPVIQQIIEEDMKANSPRPLGIEIKEENEARKDE